MFKSSLIALLALWLTGCATVRLVDNDVSTFVNPPLIAPGATYRFERLPSQQVNPVVQVNLEAMVRAALAKVSLRQDEANANYSVLFSMSTEISPYSPWSRPYMGGRWGIGFGNGMLGHNNWPGWMDSPYYWRQVSLVIRQLNTGQVVYETHAAHDGVWADNEAVYPAMLDAALQGFPSPPQGVRRVNVEIPR